jgi:hypothetical protein
MTAIVDRDDDDDTLRFTDPTPSPGGDVCDFCNASNPRWNYPASDFEFVTQLEGGREIRERYTGGWRACDPCSALIEQGDYDALARRSSQLRLLGTVPEALRPKGEVALLANVRALREHFRVHRAGPREPIRR